MRRRTKALSWGQQRAFNKMRVAGMIATIKELKKDPSTTRTEAAWLNDALHSLGHIIENWESNAIASHKLFDGR